MNSKRKKINFEQSFHVLEITKNFSLKKEIIFNFSQQGFNFAQNFPRDYHLIGDTASNQYLENVFKLGFIYSIVANFYGKSYFQKKDERKELIPLLEKIFLIYNNSPILKELSIIYMRNKIIEEKTGNILLFMDTLNLTLTMYINLMISTFIDIHINHIQYICETIDFDILIFLFGIVKNNYYKSKKSINKFLYSIFLNLENFTTGKTLQQVKKLKKVDAIKKEILLNIFNSIITVDLSSTQELAKNFLF